MRRRPTASRMRENRTSGLKGGMGKRVHANTAPLTTNGRLPDLPPTRHDARAGG